MTPFFWGGRFLSMSFFTGKCEMLLDVLDAMEGVIFCGGMVTGMT